MHFTPDPWADVKRQLWSVEPHFPPLRGVVDHEGTGASDAYRPLVQGLVGVETPRYPGKGFVEEIHAGDIERYVAAALQRDQCSPVIANRNVPVKRAVGQELLDDDSRFLCA